jgi:hypothetical protein
MRSRTAVDHYSGYGHYHVCGCGAKFADNYEPKVLCNWCKGAIIIDEDEDVTDAKTHTEGGGEQEDEEHSAADFADLAPFQFGYAKNRDGTVSAYTDGHRIRGERLGRCLVRQALTEFGVDVGCTCCVCESQQPYQEHNEDDEMDEEFDGSETESDSEDVEEYEPLESDDEDNGVPDLEDTNDAEDENDVPDFDEEQELDL